MDLKKSWITGLALMCGLTNVSAVCSVLLTTVICYAFSVFVFWGVFFTDLNLKKRWRVLLSVCKLYIHLFLKCDVWELDFTLSLLCVSFTECVWWVTHWEQVQIPPGDMADRTTVCDLGLPWCYHWRSSAALCSITPLLWGCVGVEMRSECVV